MKFDLTGPCGNCPFRNDDKAIDLREGRIEGIQDSLLFDDLSTFVCHKTLTHALDEPDDCDENFDGHYTGGDKDQACGGAMVWLLKRQQPSVMMRLTAMQDPNFYPALTKHFDKVLP